MSFTRATDQNKARQQLAARQRSDTTAAAAANSIERTSSKPLINMMTSRPQIITTLAHRRALCSPISDATEVKPIDETAQLVAHHRNTVSSKSPRSISTRAQRFHTRPERSTLQQNHNIIDQGEFGNENQAPNTTHFPTPTNRSPSPIFRPSNIPGFRRSVLCEVSNMTVPYHLSPEQISLPISPILNTSDLSNTLRPRITSQLDADDGYREIYLGSLGSLFTRWNGDHDSAREMAGNILEFERLAELRRVESITQRPGRGSDDEDFEDLENFEEDSGYED